jgi:beta-barrel assembly-enhancing protease
MTDWLSTSRPTRALATVLFALTAVSLPAQTRVTPPENKYSVAEDVKLGQQAAAQARKELPMLNDSRVDDYIDRVGARLVAAIPSEFQESQFKYTFDVINQKEINAFALPGGPMFLNRGMIEASKTEAEMAGVMAHEIAHVALRHGTANASNSTLPGLVGVAGQIGGAILGGTLGSIIGLGSQVGAQAWATKYTREYESQADILGAQILAQAGYDPREMANMFKTIEAQGGGGGPEWLSSHPNPGNRYNAINAEAQSLQVQGRADTSQFAGVQARLKELGPSYTAEQIAKGQAPTGNSPAPSARTAVKVDPPSSRLRAHSPAQFLRVSVPSNWNQMEGANNSATYAPQGGFFERNGATAFTHGVQFGVAQGTGNLQRDTQSLLQGFASSNRNLRQQSNFRRDTIGGRQGLSTTLSNVSDVTGQPEYVVLTTTSLPDGNILFMVGVAPQSEARAYESTFRRVRQSVQIATR